MTKEDKHELFLEEEIEYRRFCNSWARDKTFIKISGCNKQHKEISLTIKTEHLLSVELTNVN